MDSFTVHLSSNESITNQIDNEFMYKNIIHKQKLSKIQSKRP